MLEQKINQENIKRTKLNLLHEHLLKTIYVNFIINYLFILDTIYSYIHDEYHLIYK